MAYEIVMPRLGWTMEEGIMVEWLKHDGDPVQAGEVVCTVEGDKTAMEVESFESGILRIPPDSPPPGSKVRVGTLLGYIVRPDEAAPFEQPGTARVARESAPVTTVQSQPASAPVNSSARRADRMEPAISPRGRRVAAELGVEWRTLTGSGRTGRIVERDVRAAVAQQPSALRPRVSPLARRRAEAAAAASPEPPLPAVQSVPMSSVRRLIAERMASSAHTAAPVTLTTEADATELVRLRQQVAAT
ncbi:MAG: E3 binding domain-containing protein [Chloroflexi bacterium]|nr:E3 binding domain-containing protein [Chloroflexota bacterium]